MKKLIHNKLFLSSFVAYLISNFGDTLYYLALMNYVLLLPDTKFALGMITASETLPILAGLFIGIWADKTKNKLDTILATLVARVGLYALVGLLMGFTPALWIVAVVCLINFLSDLAGQYENGLYMPLSLWVLEAEDRETAMAFKNTVGGILMIVFRSSGNSNRLYVLPESCLFKRWDLLGQSCHHGNPPSSFCQVVERESYPRS